MQAHLKALKGHVRLLDFEVRHKFHVLTSNNVEEAPLRLPFPCYIVSHCFEGLGSTNPSVFEKPVIWEFLRIRVDFHGCFANVLCLEVQYFDLFSAQRVAPLFRVNTRMI